MENISGCGASDKEHVEDGTVAHELHRTGGVVGQRQFAVVAGVVEHAIHAARQIERDVLVAAAVVHALSVLVLQLEGLAAEVHLPEPLSGACETFVGGALETDGGTLGCSRGGVAGGHEPDRQCVVTGRREMVVAQRDGLAGVAIGIEREEGCRLGWGKQVAPVLLDGWLRGERSAQGAAGIHNAVVLKMEGHLSHMPVHHLVVVRHPVAVHGDEQAQDIVLIASYPKGMDAWCHGGVGCHVVLFQLFLERHGDKDVAVVLFHLRWRIGLP